MNINATLVIQIINFFIAYIILRKLLFEPSIRALANEEAILSEMRHAIVIDQQFIETKQAYLKQQWQESHEYCNRYKPIIKKELILQNITPLFNVKPIKSEHVQTCIIEIADVVSEKIGRL